MTEDARSSRAGGRKGGLAANVALSLAAACVFYVLCELVLFRLFLPRLPLRLQGYLPEAARILAQSSKRGVIPRDYVAVLGDSYAQGAGDWLLDSNQWRNPVYASFGVLHELSGRDVVTFGQSGAGSLEALAAVPVGRLEYLRRTLLYRVGYPKRLLVYFYEGNDLIDNLQEVRLRFKGKWDAGRMADRDYFRRFLSQVIVGENPVYRRARAFRWYDNLIFLKFVRNMAAGRADVSRAERITEDPRNYRAPKAAGKVNKAIVGGVETPLPDSLISPLMELDDDQIRRGITVFEHSLAFLREKFPEAAVTVVYIPSPLACYRITSRRVSIRSYFGKRKIFPAEKVNPRSDKVCAGIGDAAARTGCGFVDTRGALRSAAEKGRIHGPRDWKHLNGTGQRILAEALLPKLG